MYIIRGKTVWLLKHAWEAMNAEKPPISVAEVMEAIESPDRIEREREGNKVLKWVGNRTILVYYDEDEESIYVKGVSATRKRIRKK